MGPPPADASGSIVDANGKPVTGAIIQVLQSNVITQTNPDGKFLLPNVPVECGFEISHPAYKTKRYFNIDFTELKPIRIEAR